jgi:hypothetical protein
LLPYDNFTVSELSRVKIFYRYIAEKPTIAWLLKPLHIGVTSKTEEQGYLCDVYSKIDDISIHCHQHA